MIYCRRTHWSADGDGGNYDEEGATYYGGDDGSGWSGSGGSGGSSGGGDPWQWDSNQSSSDSIWLWRILCLCSMLQVGDWLLGSAGCSPL